MSKSLCLNYMMDYIAVSFLLMSPFVKIVYCKCPLHTGCANPPSHISKHPAQGPHPLGCQSLLQITHRQAIPLIDRSVPLPHLGHAALARKPSYHRHDKSDINLLNQT